MECLHRKDDLIPRSRQSKGPNRGEVMPDETHARSEAIETRTRKLQHRVGAVDPDERRLRQRIENRLRHEPGTDPEIEHGAITDPRFTEQSQQDLLLLGPRRHPLSLPAAGPYLPPATRRNRPPARSPTYVLSREWKHPAPLTPNANEHALSSGRTIGPRPTSPRQDLRRPGVRCRGSPSAAGRSVRRR